MYMTMIPTCFLLVLAIISSAYPNPNPLFLPNGLALTPPLIFFPRTAACQTEQTYIINQAELLLSQGLTSKGYKYILIDACWQGQRDKSGKIRQDPSRFPSGIQQIINQLHSRGLNVGIITDIGTKTSCGRPGSSGFQQIDANTYASWGIDYVRIENSQNLTGSRPRMTIMSQFLTQTGRRIMISLDNQGKEDVVYWGGQIANTWTTTGKGQSSWESLGKTIDKQIGLQVFSGEGAWNDAGILFGELPFIQFTSQYAIWICLKSPITLSASINTLPTDKKKLLSNSQLIALHQDPLKQQGKLILKDTYSRGWQQIWGGKLSNNRYLLIFLNGLTQPSKMQISLKKDVGLTPTSYWVRDPLNQITLGSSSNDMLVVDKVSGHGVEMRVINL